MENLAGYARVLALARVKQNQIKTFLGKAYLKFGQCLALWSYFFSLGGVLGAKHASKLEAFGPAFLGVRGELGAVERFFTVVARDMSNHSLSQSTTLFDYVMADSMKRLGYSGDTVDFFQKFGMEKIKPDTATEVAWQYAEEGAALGAIYPEVLRKMFERSHKMVPNENWERARAAGLDIPQEQDRLSYKEFEDVENELFIAYCRECCPNLYAVFIE